MTRDVQQCLMFSIAYTAVGKTYVRNPSPIIMLQVPEQEAMSTRDHPWSYLNK